MDIQAELFALQDKKYQAFQSKLMPTVALEQIIGVRTPALRKLAKEISKGEEAEHFLAALPHTYFEENHWRTAGTDGNGRTAGPPAGEFWPGVLHGE